MLLSLEQEQEKKKLMSSVKCQHCMRLHKKAKKEKKNTMETIQAASLSLALCNQPKKTLLI